MEKFVVDVDLSCTSKHLAQMYTGLEILAAKGQIELNYSYSHTVNSCTSMFIRVNSKLIFIDCADGSAINDVAYERSGLYFKRSFDQRLFLSKNKLKMYGLSYEVHPSLFYINTLRRFLYHSSGGYLSKLKSLIRASDVHNKISYLSREHSFTQTLIPEVEDDVSVMFYARLWNPDWDEDCFLNDEEREDRIRINQYRIKSISYLKEQFGDRFIGGIIEDSYSIKIAPQLLADVISTKKQNYLNQVKRIPICISTTGLHNSIGWKFAEYVVMARAIVSEPICFSVPGGFSVNQNFLEYSSPEECVDRVIYLFDNEEKRRVMMYNNHKYYQDYLAPDKLVFHILQEVINSI
ncbi:MAG: hypothetical protein QM504_04875 [Pseudomonadota bacterium]